MSIPLPRILVRLTVSVSLSLMKPRAKIGDYVMVLQKITEKGGNIG
jgi:hydrogenase maturation factor